MAYPAQGRVGNRLNAFRLGYYIEVKAILDARSNIARSGASRSDYYSKLNVVISIGGIDFSHAIRYGTLRISEALNDQPDSASFTLLPNLPGTPHVGDKVLIGLGTIENLEFGGRIVSIQHTREAARNPPFLDVLCTDFMPDFDQRLVTYSWPAQSASATILDLVARFCQQGEAFTTFGVKPNMPTLEGFEVINARPSDVMRRIATLCDGGFYIGPGRDVHAWAFGPETGFADPAPLSLALVSLKTFAHLADGAQVRSTIVVEGPHTSTPIALPASDNALADGIPVEDATMFRGQLNFEARIGSQRVKVASTNFAFNPLLARSSQTTNDVAVPATDNWVQVTYADGGAFLGDLVEPPGSFGVWHWGQVGEAYCLLVKYTGLFYLYMSAPNGSYLGLKSPVKAGTTVTKVDSFKGVQGIAGTNAANGPIRAQPAGADVIGVVRRTSANTYGWPPKNIEHLISDGRLSFAGMAERAANELDDFDHVEIKADWDTDDPNARIGRKQVIALENPDALSTTLTIFSSEITFPVPNHAPRRHNTGGTVKHADILDIVMTEKD